MRWRLLSEIQPEPVQWLWPGRIPFGKVTVLEGDPDNGKSCVAMDIGARATTGRLMPNVFDGDPIPADIIYLTAEDGLSDTVRPRFEAAGADMRRVHVLNIEDLPELDDKGMAALEEQIRATNAKLLVLDPLSAFLPDKVDSHNDKSIRKALTPLAALADRTGVAVLVIRHLNKSGGSNPKYRGGGSIGILGAARSALLAAPDPDDAERKVLAIVKHNLATPAPSLAYRLIETSEAVRIPTVAVSWLGPTEHTANDLLAEPESNEERTKSEEAEEWLRDALAGGPVLADDLYEAARKVGISGRTLKRVRKKVATTVKGGMKEGWMWTLKGAEGSNHPATKNVASSGTMAPSAYSGGFSGPHTVNGSEGANHPEGAKMPTRQGANGYEREPGQEG
jgi:hypothetical protein